MAGRSSFGFLGRFGRSADLKAFDAGLRECDVHPAQVIDGIKLAAVRLVQAHQAERSLPDQAYKDAAWLIGFCIKGTAELTAMLGLDFVAALQHRMDRALDDPESLDAELVLLALHARLVHPDVAQSYDLSIEDAPDR